MPKRTIVANERGDRTQARELLSPIYDSFSEGFNTPDLKEDQRVARRAGLTLTV
jgi:hypothetical protein